MTHVFTMTGGGCASGRGKKILPVAILLSCLKFFLRHRHQLIFDNSGGRLIGFVNGLVMLRADVGDVG